MKTVVFVLCEDHVYGGGQKSINSIKYFHPDFKIVRYGTEDINRIKNQYNCPDIRFIYPLALKEVWEKENPDLLIRLGADCLVLGTLDEVINWDYDVAAARNDPDCVGDRDEKNNRPDRIRDIPNWEWVNADFIAIKNYKFVEKYFQSTLDYWEGRELCLANQPYHDKFGKLLYRTYKGDCQSSLNIVFRLGGLKTKIFGKIGDNVFYSGPANFNSNNNYVAPSVKNEYTGEFYNWSSWYDIEYKNNEFWLQGKKVKLLHKGGGGAFKSDKLDLDLFNPQTRDIIKEIVKQ